MEKLESTKEDLTKTIEKLQVENEKLKTDSKFWYEQHEAIRSKFEHFRTAIKSITSLIN